jgi:serine/threonine-protein kinase
MNPERWRQIEQLYHAALERPSEERGAFLAEACGGGGELRREVESLLMRDDLSGGPLDYVAVEQLTSTLPVTGPKWGLLNGRYEVSAQLGRGGFGAVYHAVDRQLHARRVVIKVMLESFRTDRWRLKKFQEEIEALARINHPNVVQITDSGETPDGRPFLVMEYVNGLTLRACLKQNGMELADAASVVQQIGAALTAAHEERVVHRDLKPENVLVQGLTSSHIQVKLIDFGIAAVNPPIGPPSASEQPVAGTIRYMAPEQLMGKPDMTSDVFAFGVVAYEMLTGKLPFDAGTPAQLHSVQREGVQRTPRDLRREIPIAAEKAILRALAFSPEHRHSRACEFGDELGQALRSSAPSGDRQPNLGRLVTKMCDRRSQEDEFKSLFLNNSKDSSLNAEMYILHGEEGECHESLVERLTYQVQLLAGDARTQERPALKVKRIPWQYEGDLESRKRHLFAWLIEELGSPQRMRMTEASPATLARLLAEQLASFVVLEHDIRAARWDETTQHLIQSYREFLAEVPSTAGMPRLLVFLSVIYPPVRRSSLNLKSFVRAMGRRRIQLDLRKLAAVPDSSRICPCTVLSELAPVTRDDVLEWFSLHDIGDSEEDRLVRSERIFPREQSGLRRRMAEVEVFLREAYHTFVSERGYL